MFERWRQHLSQMRRQFFGGPVGKACENHLLELSRLLCDGLRYQWMPVSVEGHPPGRDCVQQTAAVPRVEVSTFGAFNEGWRGIKGILCEGVPDGKWLLRHSVELIPVEISIENRDKFD